MKKLDVLTICSLPPQSTPPPPPKSNRLSKRRGRQSIIDSQKDLLRRSDRMFKLHVRQSKQLKRWYWWLNRLYGQPDIRSKQPDRLSTTFRRTISITK